VLLRDADRTVDGVCNCGRRGRGFARPRFGAPYAHRIEHQPRGIASELGGHRRRGRQLAEHRELLLDRLELADRLAELLALARILHGEIEDAPDAAGELRGPERRADLER
jgi:hypothetical protein